MAKNGTFKNLAMLVLAWYPILNIYKSPLPMGFGTLILLLLFVLFLFKCRNLKTAVSLPHKFYVYWVWCAIAYIVSYLPQIKLSSFIPGGFDFFVFSVLLGFIISVFDLGAFKRHTRIVVIFAGVVLTLQELMFFTTGSRFSALIPFAELTDGQPTAGLIATQLSLDRSSSLFREPAHFAQYLLPLLCLDLFDERESGKLLSPYSYFMVALIVLIRSGNGFIGLLILMIVKSFFFLKRARAWKKIVTVIVFVPLAYYAINAYVSTDVGSSVVERTSELKNDDSAASYIRVYRGFALYGELPLLNKIIGINDSRLLQIIPSTKVSFLFSGEEQSDLYMNGVQNVLIHQGLIGLLLFILMYVSFAKGKSLGGKMQIVLFLSLSLLGQTYLSNPMMYCTALCIVANNKSYQSNENRLLYKTPLSSRR